MASYYTCRRGPVVVVVVVVIYFIVINRSAIMAPTKSLSFYRQNDYRESFSLLAVVICHDVRTYYTSVQPRDHTLSTLRTADVFSPVHSLVSLTPSSPDHRRQTDNNPQITVVSTTVCRIEIKSLCPHTSAVERLRLRRIFENQKEREIRPSRMRKHRRWSIDRLRCRTSVFRTHEIETLTVFSANLFDGSPNKLQGRRAVSFKRFQKHRRKWPLRPIKNARLSANVNQLE